MFLGELPVTGVYMEHNTGRNISDNKALKIQRIHEIISMIERDGDTRKDYQPERDFIVRKHNKELIAEIDDELRKLIPLTGYKLHTMPGIDLVTEAQIISEIGDINRFPDSDNGTGAIQLCRKG